MVLLVQQQLMLQRAWQCRQLQVTVLQQLLKPTLQQQGCSQVMPLLLLLLFLPSVSQQQLKHPLTVNMLQQLQMSKQLVTHSSCQQQQQHRLGMTWKWMCLSSSKRILLCQMQMPQQRQRKQWQQQHCKLCRQMQPWLGLTLLQLLSMLLLLLSLVKQKQ
jgi:hypothetical protein